MAHLQFPDLAERETALNLFEQQFPLLRDGTVRRACFHVDRTVTSHGLDLIRIECDYCDAAVTTVAFGTVIDMSPWYWWEDR